MTKPYPTVEDAVCAKLLARAKVGLSKYGVSLADAKLTRLQALIHAQEEALDLANYLEVEIQREQSSERREAPAEVERIPWANYPNARWFMKNNDGTVAASTIDETPVANEDSGAWVYGRWIFNIPNATIPGPWQDSLRARPEVV